MQEVVVRLQFTRQSLGYAQQRLTPQQVIYVMPRDPSRRVIFLASWWHERMDYAAKVLNRYQGLVTRIGWSQIVEGDLTHYRRTIWRKKTSGAVKSGYALHEAYLAGSTIQVSAVLPSGLPVDAFRELLDIVGRYKGISPYHSETDVYGTFDVLSIEPVIRQLPRVAEETQCSLSLDDVAP